MHYKAVYILFCMFRVSNTPIITSTQNCNYSLQYWSHLLCSCLLPTWPSLGHVGRRQLHKKKWHVQETVVTVFPDDGCGWHPKHVEWTCRIINRLLCSASRWPIINIYCTKDLTSTGGCSYSFVYSWWWVCLTPETCRIIYRMLCSASRWTIINIYCTKDVTSTGGCSYSFVYSWWWVCLTPETCRIIYRLLCVASRWTIINIDQRCTKQ